MKYLLTASLFVVVATTAPLVFESQLTPSVYCSVLMTQAQAHGYDNAADFQEEQPPQDHQKPTMACTTHNRPDGKQPCTCVKQDPEGCHQGKRVREHQSCNSWCWADLCHCCSS